MAAVIWQFWDMNNDFHHLASQSLVWGEIVHQLSSEQMVYKKLMLDYCELSVHLRYATQTESR